MFIWPRAWRFLFEATLVGAGVTIQMIDTWDFEMIVLLWLVGWVGGLVGLVGWLGCFGSVGWWVGGLVVVLVLVVVVVVVVVVVPLSALGSTQFFALVGTGIAHALTILCLCMCVSL